MIQRHFLVPLAAWVLSGSTFAALPLMQQDLAAPEAYAAAQAGELTIIDIRTPQEWRQTGVAKGVKRISMSHPLGSAGFTSQVLDSLGGNRNAPVALICRTGNRTTQVQKFLREQGFGRVYNIKEGMAGSAAGPGWLKRGLPVESCGQC